ncbi:MAG: hypothetical protein OXQ28_01485, partial [Acidobacteriota bacterium]|nr:hypothetical protein [Acidobacteriota bacterium]
MSLRRQAEGRHPRRRGLESLAGGSGGSVSGGDEHVFMRDAYRYGVGAQPAWGHHPRGRASALAEVGQRGDRGEIQQIRVA